MDGWRDGSMGMPQPTDGVFNHPDGIGVLVDWKDFVARTEIKHFPLPDLPDKAATEPFSSIPGFLENNVIGRWDMKWLIIHFGLGNIEVARQPGGDWVLRESNVDVTRLSIRPVTGKTAIRKSQPNLYRTGSGAAVLHPGRQFVG